MTDPAQLYAQLVTAFSRGSWQEAQELVVPLLPMAPQHAGVHGIAGVVSMELQQLTQAITYLRRAAELDPTRADFATLYAKALSMNGLPSEALLAADRALALSPQDPMTLDTLGVIYTQANAHERAATAFRRAAALAPTQAPYRFNLATALIAVGDIDAAELELEACIELDPTYWNPHLSLAQLRRQIPANHHVARLESLLSKHQNNAAALTYLNMALAKECEDLADYPRAFEHLVRGKSAGRGARHDSIQRDKALFEALTQAFPVTQTISTGDLSEEPIFVVGMPRSGTTLVERILSSHPDVHAAGELQNFAAALQHASGNQAPFLFNPLETIARTRDIDWKHLGSAYLASVRPSTAHASRFIDKLPHNFLYVGFIANALPNAKIICLRRDPMDTCLSNFRQLFEQGAYFDYSFDLLDTGRHYVLFDRLMAHWKNVFPGRILEVDYEALVESQESSSRRLLDFCELSWHDACLHFEDNPAPVATFSAVQVRTPLYRSSIQRWKNYEAQLTDLCTLLTEAGIRLNA